MTTELRTLHLLEEQVCLTQNTLECVRLLHALVKLQEKQITMLEQRVARLEGRRS